MGKSGYTPVGSTNWLAVMVGTAFAAVSGLIYYRHLSEFDAVPPILAWLQAEVEDPVALPEAPEAPIPVSMQTDEPAEEPWNQVALGNYTLELPGDPVEDPKPSWFARYKSIQLIDAYALPVEDGEVRISVVRNKSGKISLNAAALAAKHMIDAEFEGISTIYPFQFRDLPARHVAARPINLDEQARLHAYVVVDQDQLLVLSVTGSDQRPQRLAHQILRTVAMK